MSYSSNATTIKYTNSKLRATFIIIFDKLEFTLRR
jgi:hypothetical protein